MKYIVTAIVLLFTLLACNNSPAPQQASKGVFTDTPQLNATQLDFIKAFAAAQQEPIYLLTTFRNRYFKSIDQKELDKYLKKIKEENYLKEFIIDNKVEITLTKLLSLPNIKWLSEEDVNTCKKSKSGLWNCLKSQFNISSFYYLSLPMVSGDGKYVLVHINYLSTDATQSYGGGRIFSKINNEWKEIALLTNWGKQPNQ